MITEHPTPFSDEDPTGDTEHIPILRSGERIGFGGMKYPGRPGAAEIQVEIGEPDDWMPEAWFESNEAYSGFHLGELTVTAVDVRPGESNEPVTSFTVESSYEQAVSPIEVYVVFYDAEGRIIGGADDFSVVGSIPAGGAVDAEIGLDDPIEVPGIDPARTEVYFPGFRMASR